MGLTISLAPGKAPAGDRCRRKKHQGDRMRKNPWYCLFILLILVAIPVQHASSEPLTGTLTPISVGTPTAYHWEPSLSGNYIVWRDDRTGEGNIFLYDIATGTERQLSNSAASEEKPAVSGSLCRLAGRPFYRCGERV